MIVTQEDCFTVREPPCHDVCITITSSSKAPSAVFLDWLHLAISGNVRYGHRSRVSGKQRRPYFTSVCSGIMRHTSKLEQSLFSSLVCLCVRPDTDKRVSDPLWSLISFNTIRRRRAPGLHVQRTDTLMNRSTLKHTVSS